MKNHANVQFFDVNVGMGVLEGVLKEKSPGQPQKLYSFLANLGKEVRRGDKGKKTRSTSDDAGGKSVIKKSQATRTSQTPFEASKGETEKYFVDSLKDKRTGKKCPEFLIE